MKTGFSLCTFSLQGKTCFHYRFFPVKKAYTGKTLFSLQGGFAVYSKRLPGFFFHFNTLIFDYFFKGIRINFNFLKIPHCKPIPVMKTGFSLCTLSLQGKTCNENRFFPVKKAYTGKTLFSLQGWVCSAVNISFYKKRNVANKQVLLNSVHIVLNVICVISNFVLLFQLILLPEICFFK